MNRHRVGGALTSAAQGLMLIVLTIVVSLLLFVLTFVSLALILVGIGLFTTPVLLSAVRMHANQRRLLAQQWAGVTIPAHYRPFPTHLSGGIGGQVRHTIHLLRDPATWRDFLWLFADLTAGFIVAVLPVLLFGQGLFGYILAAGVWRPIHNGVGTYWYAFVPVNSQFTAFLAAGLGTLWITLALYFSSLIIRGHFLLARFVLGGVSEKQVLSQRVERLQETRHDAVDSSAAELRRIERDLHDGAQARLVAMGMSLGTIEALIEKDPEKAKALLAQTRENSAEALTELRDLVRGIHPPVLAERGLGDAVRALALRTPLPVDVDVSLPGRLEEPVETCAYFAISEVLTNAAKHSGATHVWLDAYYSQREGTLRIAITDDGSGGARLDTGSGLPGIERRLGSFDGILAVSSPVGGPTLVTIEIPCVMTVSG